jgi:hypothetical protein
MPTPRIHPPGIPTVKNLGMYVQLKATAVQLRGAGQRYRSGGVDFHKRFQDLEPPIYKAPEGEDLRRSTQPVSDNAWWFGSQMVKLSDILWHFADRAHYWETELQNVKEDAWRFVHSIEHYEHGEWSSSAEKVAQNNALMGRVEAALTGRLNDEVETRKRIYALIFVSPRPPDLGQGSSQAKQMPWGSRAKPPSVLDNLIWKTSYGLPEWVPGLDALPSWANGYFRFANPLRTLAGGLLLGGMPLIWHHAEDLATGKIGSRLQKDLEALNGLAQLAVGLSTLSVAGLAGLAVRKQMPEYLPEGFRNWMDEADKAALGFGGFDKIGEGDILGGLGTFVANVGGLIATRKLPAGLGASVALSRLGRTGAITALGRTGAIGRGIANSLRLGEHGRFGKGLDAVIDAAPLRFVKDVGRVNVDLPVTKARVAQDFALGQTHRAEREALSATQTAKELGIRQKQQEIAAADARSRREADIVKAFKRHDADNDIAENRRIADAERPPTPDEIRARQEADTKSEETRDENDKAVAKQRVGHDKAFAERQAKDAGLRAIQRADEWERLDIRQVGDRTAINIERERADELRDAPRKAFDKGTEFGDHPVRSTAIALRELNKLKGSALANVDLEHAKDPFEEGRPLDEAADRLQQLPGIDRDEAEDLVKRFVRARHAGATQADIDALQARVNGDGLAGLRRELDELARQRR